MNRSRQVSITITVDDDDDQQQLNIVANKEKSKNVIIDYKQRIANLKLKLIAQKVERLSHIIDIFSSHTIPS
jgi:hypothetical protein